MLNITINDDHGTVEGTMSATEKDVLKKIYEDLCKDCKEGAE